MCTIEINLSPSIKTLLPIRNTISMVFYNKHLIFSFSIKTYIYIETDRILIKIIINVFGTTMNFIRITIQLLVQNHYLF